MVLLYLLLAAADPSQGASMPPATPVQEKSAAPVKEKKVCRSEMVSGSIMPKLVCTTAAQRAEQSQGAQQALESQQRAFDRSR